MNDLRDAMRKEAGRVWREKAKAQQLGLFMNEETVTETILLHLAMRFQGRGLWVRPFTKAQEAKNGADWEFWFAQGSEAIGLRVQAKRLFPSGEYSSLHLTSSQTQNLINKSGLCHPAFVFYNDSRAYIVSEPSCYCGYYGPSYRGCTLASARVVRSQGKNDADSIAKVAIPWHCLLCSWISPADTVLPQRVASSLSRLINVESSQERGGTRQLATGELPGELRDYAESSLRPESADTFEEPYWLAGYLERHALAGVALIVAENGED